MRPKATPPRRTSCIVILFIVCVAFTAFLIAVSTTTTMTSTSFHVDDTAQQHQSRNRQSQESHHQQPQNDDWPTDLVPNSDKTPSPYMRRLERIYQAHTRIDRGLVKWPVLDTDATKNATAVILVPFAVDSGSLDLFFGRRARSKTDRDAVLNSRLVVQADFNRTWYRDTLRRDLKLGFVFHRKQWEMVAVFRAVAAVVKNFSRESVSGFGFGVGVEPLPSAFVAAGCKKLVVSDLPQSDGAAAQWSHNISNVNHDQQHHHQVQYAANLEATWMKWLVPSKEHYFASASFFPVNMRTMDPYRLIAQAGFDGGTPFDFVWSTSALEHQGTVQDAVRFIVNSAQMLKPGGVAVHTTEIIVSSLELLIEMPDVFTMLRVKDIERLARALEEQADAKLMQRDYFAGDGPFDVRCDMAPYHSAGHLKLHRYDSLASVKVRDHYLPPHVHQVEVCHTSVVLVVRKNL